MEDKNFRVDIFYSGYCTYEIQAKTEDEAIIKARKLPVNKKEILNTLECWQKVDTAKK